MLEPDAFDADLPLARASTVPGSWYADPQVARAERDGIFLASWQFVARADQLAAPGQFVTAQIAGEPVLVVRGKDGQLTAVANVCRHRAARIEPRAEGTASRFRCRYHGWAYDLGGKLVGTPDFQGVEEFCKDDHPLPRYHVAEWGPLDYVHLGTPRETLAELMAPVERLSGFPRFAHLKFAARRTYEMNCNWKIFVDNYLDGGYHIPTLHPGLASVVDMDGYHTVIDGLSSVQISPLRPTSGEREDAVLNNVRSGDAAHYWWVWPNFMINIYAGTMDTNLVLPLGPDKCLCIFDFWFAPEQAADEAYVGASLEVAHQVQLEDQDICEEVQRGLESRAYDRGRFSVRREAGGHHFHGLLAKAVRSSAL
jgi:choline monooxygenase